MPGVRDPRSLQIAGISLLSYQGGHENFSTAEITMSPRIVTRWSMGPLAGAFVLSSALPRITCGQHTEQRLVADTIAEPAAAVPWPRMSMGVWSGLSLSSRGPVGLVSGRKMLLLGFTFRRTLVQTRRVALAYTIDLIPVALVTNNLDADIQSIPGGSGFTVGRGDTRLAYGFGVSPIGLRFHPWQTARFRVGTGFSVGFLTFDQAVPFRNTRKFNFVGEIFIDAELTLDGRWAILGGYKVHHLSNAGTVEHNPGLDANIFFVGVTRATEW